jgi:hypothetical protein
MARVVLQFVAKEHVAVIPPVVLLMTIHLSKRYVEHEVPACCLQSFPCNQFKSKALSAKNVRNIKVLPAQTYAQIKINF